ncbi:MAG: anti-sigma factor family protein [Ktedonobacteraceae bacterium]
MTAPIPKNHAQMVALLPMYLNGRLTAAEVQQVRAHLVSCVTCQCEIASWEALKGASKQIFDATPLPSLDLLDHVWAQIEAPVERPLWSPGRVLSRLWQVFCAQIPLIHKSIWVASALVCLFGLSLTLFMGPHVHGQKSFAANLLVLFIVIAGASGSAFIYGASVDPGFELTITTPTSIRLLMLCRMVLVLGYNFLLAIVASAVFAGVYGSGLWGIIQLWLGPLLFLSSLCLTISLCVGSTFALICTLVIDALQAFPTRFAYFVSLPLPALDLGPTSPVLLIAALLLFTFAVFYVPRQPRLTCLT